MGEKRRNNTACPGPTGQHDWAPIVLIDRQGNQVTLPQMKCLHCDKTRG